jgi:hypothetical protein
MGAVMTKILLTKILLTKILLTKILLTKILLASFALVAVIMAQPATAADDAVLQYKAPPPLVVKGQFDVFVEGGGFWTGGDPALTFFPMASFFSTRQGSFDLKPLFGWDAAAGFDYRFAGSPWHVSAQARYGAAQKSDSSSSSVGPFCCLGAFIISETAATTATNNETHWLADFAIGHDLNIGADAMQVKVGVRVAQLTSKIGQGTNSALKATPLFPLGAPSEFELADTTNEQDTSFRGAGPRLGVDGKIPLGGAWEFDYLADGAVLFGTRRFDTNSATTGTFVGFHPPIPQIFEASAAAYHIGATVPNVDIQAGFAYWITPNFRLTASYRLDAFFGAITTLDVTGKQVIADRYFHGPRLTGTLQF